jgi:acyl-CoA thioester hydrolase
MSSEKSVPQLDAGRTFTMTMPVRWGDMDAVGHVNNTIYFRFVEEARAQCFDAENLFFPHGRVPILVHASLDFLKSVIYPATVVVRLVLTRQGTSSLAFDVEIECDGEPGVLYAKGHNIVVATRRDTGRSAPWTAHEIEGLARAFV